MSDPRICSSVLSPIFTRAITGPTSNEPTARPPNVYERVRDSAKGTTDTATAPPPPPPPPLVQFQVQRAECAHTHAPFMAAMMLWWMPCNVIILSLNLSRLGSLRAAAAAMGDCDIHPWNADSRRFYFVYGLPRFPAKRKKERVREKVEFRTVISPNFWLWRTRRDDQHASVSSLKFP